MTCFIATTLLLATLGLGAAYPTPPPAAAPGPTPTSSAGPCADPPLGSIAVRPGIGRTPATGGAVCVAEPGTVAIGIGFRSQITSSATSEQRLEVYPAPVALIGIGGENEIIVEPGLSFSRRIGENGFGLAPGSGQQDAGIGLQHLVSDTPRVQQAVSLFGTYPTGYPYGPSGFTIGGPSYQVAYTVAVPVTGILGATVGNTFIVAPGFAPDSSLQRFIAYQPSLALSLSVTPSTTLLFEDQFATITSPHGPSGDRALFGIQQAFTARAVLDVEYERNLLPPAGFTQHTTFEGGVTVRI